MIDVTIFIAICYAQKKRVKGEQSQVTATGEANGAASQLNQSEPARPSQAESDYFEFNKSNEKSTQGRQSLLENQLKGDVNVSDVDKDSVFNSTEEYLSEDDLQVPQDFPGKLLLLQKTVTVLGDEDFDLRSSSHIKTMEDQMLQPRQKLNESDSEEDKPENLFH